MAYPSALFSFIFVTNYSPSPPPSLSHSLSITASEFRIPTQAKKFDRIFPEFDYMSHLDSVENAHGCEGIENP